MVKIGNKNHISFELKENDSPEELMSLNFYLGGKLISDEQVYLPTYISSLQNLRDDITSQQFQSSNLRDLSPEQVYKILLKERDSDEPQFFRHSFQLDETIDQYTIFAFQEKEFIKFVWTCWDKHSCNSEHELNIVYSVQFQTKELISTVSNLIERLQ